MIKRPSAQETEKDLLEMERQFFAEKNKNPNMQPAATVVRMKNSADTKKSLFAKSRQQKANNQLKINSINTIELLNGKEETIIGNKTSSGVIFGDIFDSQKLNSSNKKSETTEKTAETKRGKSLFALSFENKDTSTNEIKPFQQQVDMANIPHVKFGRKSVMVNDDNTAKQIHKENVNLLQKMSHEEIVAERTKLLETMDPAIVSLIQKRREKSLDSANTSKFFNRTDIDKNILQEKPGNDILSVDTISNILERSSTENWVHFDVIENDKLEWMRDISTSTPLNPFKKFEARFDWKGVLLPYSLEENRDDKVLSQKKVDNRELYLHGDDPHRPGYTLQEFFRLARSQVIQQRISAFGAIAGILSIYNQGFYDHVLELPITKIFFLLRFGFDDNTPAMLEVSSRALAYLFYNETDEALLDFIHDNPGCHWQPSLDICSSSYLDDLTEDQNLEKVLTQMQTENVGVQTKPRFNANVNESKEFDTTTMNDFHLAETDLIDCLLRTNILQRITFILKNMRPENSTVLSCFKLLIRIARSRRHFVTQIVDNDELCAVLFQNFLPIFEHVDTQSDSNPLYNYPQFLCLKLIRILISENLSTTFKFCFKYNLIEILQCYLFSRQDIGNKLIKVQIECLRIFRSLMFLRYDKTSETYKKFVPTFHYMLKWHYNHDIYEMGGHFLIRQHAAAVLSAITSFNIGVAEVNASLGQSLQDCCCSWFFKATREGVKEFSQMTLLTACLNAVTWYTRCFGPERFQHFIKKYLFDFIATPCFIQLINSLKFSSVIIRSEIDRRNIHPPLPNVGAIMNHEYGPQLILSQTYPGFLLASLWSLLETQLARSQKTLFDTLVTPTIIEPLIDYLKILTKRTNHFLATNFFAKSEMSLVFKLICFDGFLVYLNKEEMFRLAFNYLCCLTAEYIPEIEILFERFMFNKLYFDIEIEELEKWKALYLEQVYPHYIVVDPIELSLSVPYNKSAILSRDWPYYQLRIILENFLNSVQQKPEILSCEREILEMTLKYTGYIERKYKLENLMVTPTEKLMYFMITFMGPESQFLEPEIRSLLREHMEHFYIQYKTYTFNFDTIYKGKCRFDNLYLLFLEHFQAASYGCELFGSLILIPLAQKYDNKYRRRVWSDYAGVLRFLDCTENLLLGGFEAYTTPNEEDDSLLKSYRTAINSHSVRTESLPYRIAKHHLDQLYKRKREEKRNK